MISTKTLQEELHSDVSINVVNVSVSEDRATALAKLLTEAGEQSKGFWIRNEKEYSLVAYTRCPESFEKKNKSTTIYADAMVIEVSNEEEYKLVSDYVKSRNRIPQIIFYSDFDFSKLAEGLLHSNAKWVKKSENDAESLRKLIVNYYHELKVIIKTVFDKFDLNKNGMIERDELEKVSLELGENITSEDFIECLRAIDHNKDQSISFDEFTTWWKLGRQNSFVMGKLVQLQLISSRIIDNKKIDAFATELQIVKDSEKLTSKHHLKFYSEQIIESPGVQALLHIVKGLERLDYVKNHLLRFSDHANAHNARWVEITLEFDSSVNKEEALKHTKENIEKMFLLFDDVYFGLNETFHSFFEMEYAVGILENSVNIRFRQKLETQKSFDQMFAALINLLVLIPGNQQILLDIKSELNLTQCFEKNLTYREFLNNYSIEFKMDLVRDIKRLFPNVAFPFIITAPHDLQLNCRMNFENLFPSNFLKMFEFPMSSHKEMLDMMVNTALGEDTLFKKITCVEVHANAFDIFVGLKLRIPGLFK